MTDSVARTLKLLPDRPGVYLMKNSAGQIIYIGKAKNLAHRVRSYFHSSGLNLKTQALVRAIADISYIVVSSEMEALLLENNLIKQHKPYYNILLKDDKGYPFLRLDIKDEYPRLTLARKLVRDGALYFGPYSGARLAEELAGLAGELYPLRSCSAPSSKLKNQRPCIKYSLGKCVGACRQDVTSQQYRALAEGTAAFLGDGYRRAAELLKKKMSACSDALEFEKAAYYRDRIQHLEKAEEEQKAVLKSDAELDAVGMCGEDDYSVITVLNVRAGRLIGAHTEELPRCVASGSELMEEYLLQRYGEEDYIPREILLYEGDMDFAALSQHFTQLRGAKCEVRVPERGDKAKLCAMARDNAREVLEKSLKAEQQRSRRTEDGLRALAEAVGLSAPPSRIECYDISHIQGTDTVASMVVLQDGLPNPREYRRFKIKTVEGNNDFASMAEVISRRFTRLCKARDGDKDSAAFAALPDLVVIDGGKGQLSSAEEILQGLKLHPPILGLAKRLEEIYLPGKSESILLGTRSPAIHILQTVRDEAHRFAITYHRSLRGKRSLLSRLDGIPGVGEKRRRALLRAFGTVDAISAATTEELAAVNGMNGSAAKNVYDYFKKDGKTEAGK